MAQAVRVIIFNSDESYGARLRGHVLTIEGAKIVAEIDDAMLVEPTLQRAPCDVLLAHLDPDADATVEVIGDAIANHGGVNFFALSASTEGRLILTAMRKGFREFLPKPIEEPLWREAFGKVVSRLVESPCVGKLISVIGTIGGAGGTTVACNLAVELAELTRQEVALVDLDYRFGQVATFLDLQPNYTLADLTGSLEQLEEQVIRRALAKHDSNVHVLARPSHFAQADNITASHCVTALSALQTMFAYVVVDGPTRYDATALPVLDMTDYDLLVIQQLVPSVRNVQRIIDSLKEIGFATDRLRLVCNRIGREAGNVTLKNIEDTLNLKIFAGITDDWKTVSSAINMGEPLATHSPRSKVRTSIQELAARLHQPPQMSDDKTGSEKGGSLLGRIFTKA